MLDLSAFSQYVKAPPKGDAPTIRVPKAKSITCPSILTGEAKKEFKRITEELETLGFLHQVDRALITMYAICWADYLEAVTTTRIEGIGTPQSQKPGFWLRNTVEKRLLQLAGELGLSPNARARIQKVLKAADEDAPPPVMQRPFFN